MKTLGEALRHCSSLIWTCDVQGNLTYLSFPDSLPASSPSTLLTLESLLPMVCAQDRQRRARELRCALLDRTGRRCEYVAVRRDGVRVSICEEISPIWRGTRFKGLVGVGSSHAPQQQKHENHEILTQVGALNHEVRNCLSAISGTLQLLTEAKLGKDEAERVAAAQTACESVLQLLQDSLDTHKLRMGASPLQNVRYSPEKRAKAVFLGLQTMARERGSCLRIEVARDTPSMVWGDPHRLGQILSNLLTNALKYSKGGRVTLRVMRGGNGLVYSVEDTGPGIDEEFQKVMFGAYQQEPLKGEFHALVVEDQPLVAQALVAQLRKLGVTARVAQSGEQALLELAAQIPQLIFLDLHLGGSDGFTVCREIRRRHGSASVVVGLTGDTAKGIRRRCIESGMDDCVFKPLSYARLSRLLKLVGSGGRRQGDTVEEERAQLNR